MLHITHMHGEGGGHKECTCLCVCLCGRACVFMFVFVQIQESVPLYLSRTREEHDIVQGTFPWPVYSAAIKLTSNGPQCCTKKSCPPHAWIHFCTIYLMVLAKLSSLYGLDGTLYECHRKSDISSDARLNLR